MVADWPIDDRSQAVPHHRFQVLAKEASESNAWPTAASFAANTGAVTIQGRIVDALRPNNNHDRAALPAGGP